MQLPIISRSRVLALSLGAATLLFTACGGSELDVERTAQSEQPIVNGKVHDGHPAVGGLIQGQGGMCTATLVGKKTVLTAAHCVTPGAYHLFILDNRRWDVDAVARHPGYQPDSQQIGDDVALVRLREAPPIAPMPIGVLPPELGQKVSLVGLGATSHQGGGSGFKRIASNTVARRSSKTLTYRFAGGDVGNLCFGDSGGPTFAIINGQEVQVGIHSYIRGTCGQEGNDMRVDAYLEWIKTNSGGDVLEGGHPDKLAPEVSITSPVATDELYPKVTVEISATDDTAVAKVELRVDGKLVGSAEKAPYRFELELQPGDRVLEASAVDAAGNSGKASLSVTINEPKVFGELCAAATQCGSDLCASHPQVENSFCTQACDAASNPCPEGASCQDAGGTFVCGPPASLLPQSGGCAVASDDGNAGLTATGLTVLLLLGLALISRRR
jgi:MYXO-CTERM domain-containing protein